MIEKALLIRVIVCELVSVSLQALLQPLFSKSPHNQSTGAERKRKLGEEEVGGARKEDLEKNHSHLIHLRLTFLNVPCACVLF